jgi:hypothetical protein
MAPNRKKSTLLNLASAKQTLAAEKELNARKSALLTWKAVTFGLGAWCDESYIRQVAMGKRVPSRRLLLALGIVKPEKRNDIRIRMTLSDAREIVEHDTMPVNVKNRIRYAMWGKK